MTIKEAVRYYSESLKNTDNPVREARLLTGLATGLTLSEIIANPERILTVPQLKKLEAYALRRASGEPFAYISGEKEFMGMSFLVNKNVLIPRPDTEILVNIAAGKETSVLDLCTGSGCVAVSLAKVMPWALVTAVDVSKEALKIAEINAKNNGVDIEFIKKDLLKNKIRFDKKFMLAVCNPPYIESKTIEGLEKDVKEFEPLLALDGGEDGLEFYRKIVNDAELFLEIGGRLCFEIGFNQGEAVREIMEEKFEQVEIIKDFAGQNRVVQGILKKLNNHDHNGHRKRLRQRYNKEGLDHFQPHEVLELILCYSIPRRDVNEIAHRLIKRFGSLAQVLEASPEQLMEIGEITENTAVLLNMIPNLSRVYVKDKWKEKVLLTNTYVTGKYVVDLFVGQRYEAYYIICLNGSNGVIACEKLGEGTLNEVAVYPRNVVEIAIKNKANKIILAHNHPSGNPLPSWNDIELTKRVKAAVENIDIIFSDHIVVGGESFISMAEKKLI